MGLWESADVDVLPGKRCFAVESSQAERAISWAGWAPLTPPWLSPRRPSLSLPQIYTTFPRGRLADTLDATPPGGSSQIMTKSWPPTKKLAPCGTREGLLSGRWRLTIGWCWKQQTGGRREKEEEGEEEEEGARESDRQINWLCGMAVSVVSELSRVQDQGSGVHCSAAVRCAPQVLLETTTSQALVAGLMGQAQF
ncbi:hypothetical protein L3Q82_012470 [Scortum barcoo]|uniref:Uncharacterized protein n=1 Tax=Scortum barcoo TaxID=214431 RepID=A0ACB8W323_9TELE|nr:hypothetical protein L3Q82_012470 [Scortum barcoo]